MKPTPNSHIRHFVASSPCELGQVLGSHLRLSETEITDLLRLGAVYLNKRRVSYRTLGLKKGDYLRVHVRPKRYTVPSLDWKQRVVHADPDFVVANKPAGIPTHAMLDNQVENLAHLLSKKLGYPLWVTQRLDIPTQGLIVLARNKEFQARFNSLLGDRKVRKRYRALAEHPVPLGIHTHYMRPDERTPKVLSDSPEQGWWNCILHVQDSKELREGIHEMQIELLTGRTHQIRAQLAKLGAPIIGDGLYGGHWKKDFFGLQSFELAFDHRKKNFHFQIDRPVW